MFCLRCRGLVCSAPDVEDLKRIGWLPRIPRGLLQGRLNSASLEEDLRRRMNCLRCRGLRGGWSASAVEDGPGRRRRGFHTEQTMNE